MAEQDKTSDPHGRSHVPVVLCHPEPHMFPGAVGGFIVGLTTGYFNPSRMPKPISPFPEKSPRPVHDGTRFLVTSSSIAWRMLKRMFIGAILYPTIVCQLQGIDKNPGIVACTIAGGMSGAIFGLRGGPSGVVKGTIVFGTMTGMYKVFNKLQKAD